MINSKFISIPLVPSASGWDKTNIFHKKASA
jgi:hypothetical protein